MTSSRSGGSIVVGVDGSDTALQAVRWAAAEATQRRSPLRLVSAYAAPAGRLVGDPGLGVDYRTVARDSAARYLAAAATAATAVAPDLAVEQVLVEGFPTSALRAESVHATLVVLGDRGLGGFSEMLLGSVAVALAAHAACPVVAVRGPDFDTSAPRVEPVLVGVDGSPASEAAVAFAFEAAALRAVPLVAVHAWYDLLVDPVMAPLLDVDAVEADEREVLAERLAAWSRKHPEVDVRRLVVRDRPGRALVQESASAQLVVVGSRGRGGLAGMALGSVSHALLHHAHCPVAVVRPAQVVAPVDRTPRRGW
jgi:nucleotide-binding universal stress UspA family protein